MSEEEIAINRRQLEEELKQLLVRWDDWDKRTLTVKAWVAAGSIAAFFAMGSGSTNAFWVAPFVAALVFCFWVMDANVKSTQHLFQFRIGHLEEVLSAREHTWTAPYQTTASWEWHYQRLFKKDTPHVVSLKTFLQKFPQEWAKLIRRELWKIGCMLPYFPIIACLGLYLLIAVGKGIFAAC